MTPCRLGGSQKCSLSNEAPDTPTKGISNQLSKTTITQNSPAAAAVPQNPFTTTEGGRGNLFWNQQTTPCSNAHQPNPSTNPEEELAIIRETNGQFIMAKTDQEWMEQVTNGVSNMVTPAM